MFTLGMCHDASFPIKSYHRINFSHQQIIQINSVVNRVTNLLAESSVACFVYANYLPINKQNKSDNHFIMLTKALEYKISTLSMHFSRTFKENSNEPLHPSLGMYARVNQLNLNLVDYFEALG